jgi:hypothetical protein
MSTIMVFIGARLGWGLSTFAAINVGLALGWIAFVLLIGKEHKRRSAEDGAQIAAEPVAAEPAIVAPLQLTTLHPE